MHFGLAFQFRSASAGIASSIFRVDASSRSYSAINSSCMSIGNLRNLVPDQDTRVFAKMRSEQEDLSHTRSQAPEERVTHRGGTVERELGRWRLTLGRFGYPAWPSAGLFIH